MNPAKSRIFITRILVVAVVAFYVLGTSAWIEKNTVVEHLLFLVGTVLVGVGVVGRAWCLGYISGRKNRNLVREGPYSLCRNPLYLFSLVATVGLGLCSQTLIIPAIIIVTFLVYYPFVIREEEKRLKESFPSEWEEYSRKVPRFIPSFANFDEASEMTISPGSYRKELFDLVHFVIIIGGFEVIEMFHEAGYLPTFYLIY